MLRMTHFRREGLSGIVVDANRRRFVFGAHTDWQPNPIPRLQSDSHFQANANLFVPEAYVQVEETVIAGDWPKLRLAIVQWLSKYVDRLSDTAEQNVDHDLISSEVDLIVAKQELEREIHESTTGIQIEVRRASQVTPAPLVQIWPIEGNELSHESLSERLMLEAPSEWLMLRTTRIPAGLKQRKTLERLIAMDPLCKRHLKASQQRRRRAKSVIRRAGRLRIQQAPSTYPERVSDSSGWTVRNFPHIRPDIESIARHIEIFIFQHQ